MSGRAEGFRLRRWTVEHRRMRMRRGEIGPDGEMITVPIVRTVVIRRRRRDMRETWAELIARAA
jgi:hypothetical protein